MVTVKGIFFCAQSSLERVFGTVLQAAIAERLDLSAPLVTFENWREHRAVLAEAEVLISSWGGAMLDEEMLAALPKLKMYFYGAGSIHGLMTDAAWKRGIRITSAAAMNAVPVAEFVLAQTILSLKRAWEYMPQAKAGATELWQSNRPVRGMYGAQVGLVGYGAIARKTANLLRPFDVEIYASSLSLLPDEAGVHFVSTEKIFSSCDVVSLHLPSNGGTKGMINRKLLETMKPNATLINTARGAIIHSLELIEFLRERPDVYACLDVTDPEPPEPNSPLLGLPNVVLTPHLAGSAGRECRRMGQFVVDEIDRYLANLPLQGEITREQAASLA